MNCNQIQGFLFSKPLPLKEFETYLIKGYLSSILPNGNMLRNRRSMPRIELDSLLLAKMTILTVMDKAMDIGKSEILIKNISKAGMQFLSNVKLLFHPEVVYSFEVITSERKMKLRGKIIWSKEWDEGIYRYGVELVSSGNQNTAILKQLKGSLGSKSHFEKTNVFDFFKAKGS